MTMSEFKELEVDERTNYEPEMIDEWMKKYNLTDNSEVIWVSSDKRIANRYNLPAVEWENAMNIPEEEIDVVEISNAEGKIITESDDGDDGFLFVYY
jgi:hypothetical protein